MDDEQRIGNAAERFFESTWPGRGGDDDLQERPSPTFEDPLYPRQLSPVPTSTPTEQTPTPTSSSPTPATTLDLHRCDLNFDGVIDEEDLLIFLDFYFKHH